MIDLSTIITTLYAIGIAALFVAIILVPAMGQPRFVKLLALSSERRQDRVLIGLLIFGSATYMTADFIRFFTSRSEEHTSEIQSLMRISYAVFCFKKTTKK